MTRATSLLAVAALALFSPSAVLAEGELTGVIGALVGGDLNSVLQGNVSIQRAFENGPLYGGRIGWIGYPFGVEASFVGSPSGLSANALDGAVSIDARVIYVEANVLFIPIPGPVSPFAMAGAGLHSYEFTVRVTGVNASLGTDVRKLGFNFGGGLKVNISRIALRAEVRDHVTEFELGDFGVGGIGDLLGINVSQRVHNVEVSFGVGVRF